MKPKKIKSFEEELDCLKDRLINKAILGSSIFFIPAYISSILRFKTIGWHPLYVLHTFFIVIFVFLIIKRKKLHYHLKTHIFCVIIMLLSIGSIVFFQTAGDKIPGIISVLIAVLILGVRIGFLYAIAYFIIYILLIILHRTEVLSVSVDLNTYSNDLVIWIMYTSSTILYLGIIISTLTH